MAQIGGGFRRGADGKVACGGCGHDFGVFLHDLEADQHLALALVVVGAGELQAVWGLEISHHVANFGGLPAWRET